MKIGIFDSGIGGLLIAQSIVETMPQYDYVYLGDTARMPYGNRTHEEIFTYVCEGVDFLKRQGCSLVILACNSASAEALREYQQLFVPPESDFRVLGVIIPAIESTRGFSRIGVVATPASVSSKTFSGEAYKQNPEAETIQYAAKDLAQAIEQNNIDLQMVELGQIQKFFDTTKIDCLVLGCTHYPLLKKEFEETFHVPIISQTESVPRKLHEYLVRNSDKEALLSNGATRSFYVTQLSAYIQEKAYEWFGAEATLHEVVIQS